VPIFSLFEQHIETIIFWFYIEFGVYNVKKLNKSFLKNTDTNFLWNLSNINIQIQLFNICKIVIFLSIIEKFATNGDICRNLEAVTSIVSVLYKNIL
jgi:hypothetical protein